MAAYILLHCTAGLHFERRHLRFGGRGGRAAASAVPKPAATAGWVQPGAAPAASLHERWPERKPLRGWGHVQPSLQPPAVPAKLLLSVCRRPVKPGRPRGPSLGAGCVNIVIIIKKYLLLLPSQTFRLLVFHSAFGDGPREYPTTFLWNFLGVWCGG